MGIPPDDAEADEHHEKEEARKERREEEIAGAVDFLMEKGQRFYPYVRENLKEAIAEMTEGDYWFLSTYLVKDKMSTPCEKRLFFIGRALDIILTEYWEKQARAYVEKRLVE
jgi:hypothetical protein